MWDEVGETKDDSRPTKDDEGRHVCKAKRIKSKSGNSDTEDWATAELKEAIKLYQNGQSTNAKLY